MCSIHLIRPNPLSGSPLDRLDSKRKDSGWVDDQLASPDTAFIPVWRDRNLVSDDRRSPSLQTMPSDHARTMLSGTPWAFLGRHGDRAYVALDLSADDTPSWPGQTGRFEDLRRVGGVLPGEDAAILAHARGLMYWRVRHRFCGVCGAICLPRSAGHVMGCTGCQAQHFPRTDPAVIMLVTHGDRALLGQPARFRDLRIFTTLAGFVEPGESLEEAVAREVYEEVSVRVGDVRYHSSQPWPFPASIMLGFTAEAEADSIEADADEIVEARWFTRDELRQPDGFVLPPPVSIARRLIEDWTQGLLDRDPR